jgi:hypothetical protein
VVARLEVLGLWWSTVTRAEEEGSAVNLLVRHMVGGLSSNLLLEEEATMVSLFPSLNGDESGSVVAGHGEQSRRVVERSRAVAGRCEGEGNGRRVPLLATHERVRTTPCGVVVTSDVWLLLRYCAWCHTRALASGVSS